MLIRSTSDAATTLRTTPLADAISPRRVSERPVGYSGVSRFDPGVEKLAPPARLTDAQLLGEARAFLASRGKTVGSDTEVKKLLRENADLRRDYLYAQATRERASRSRTSVELFSNTLQRARFFNSREQQRGFWELWKPERYPVIDGHAAASDVGLLFCGARSVTQAIAARAQPSLGDQRWNLNAKEPLPATGFKADRLNDDEAGPTADQTHHVAFYTLLGERLTDPVDRLKAKLVALTVTDRGHPNEVRLASDGIDLGSVISDPGVDVNEWIWDRFGDPNNVG